MMEIKIKLYTKGKRMENKMKKLFLLLFLFCHSFAGEKSGISGISMGNIFVATTGGIEAIGTNPSRLASFDRPKGKIKLTFNLVKDTVIGEFKTVLTQNIIDSLISKTFQDTSYFFEENKIFRKTRYDSIAYIDEELPNFTFTFLPVSMQFGSDFFNYDIYSKFFTGEIVNGKKIGKHLSDNDKNEILKIFPEGIAENNFDFETKLFASTIHTKKYGHLGFAITEKVNVNFNIPKDYIRFPLYGFSINGSQYDFSGTKIEGQIYQEIAIAYAKEINFENEYLKNFSFGISPKIIQGFAYFNLDKYNVNLGTQLNANGIDSLYNIYGNANIHFISTTGDFLDSAKNFFDRFFSPSGNGFAFDLGINCEILNGISFGMSLTDIGKIKWSKNVIENSIESYISISNLVSQQSQDSIEKFVDKLTSDIKNLEGDTVKEFSSQLPTALNIGISWMQPIKYVGDILIGVQLQKGFNDAPGNSKRTRISFGSEYRLVKWFPIRMGIGIGGKNKFNIAGGFGFDFYYGNIDVGFENIVYIFTPTPKAINQVSFGVGMKFRF